MEIQPVDLTALIPATLGVLIVLIPVLGFTVRFAIKPIVDALARGRESAGPGREVELLAARVRELEEEVIRLKNTDPYRVGAASRQESLPTGQGRG
jgi:siroheme synthase